MMRTQAWRIALGAWLVLAAGASAAATAADDGARILAFMSASPPADRAVAFTLRLLPGPGSGIQEEQEAVVESTGSVLLVRYRAPAHLKDHLVLARDNRITYRPATGRTTAVFGTYRQFAQIPLARLASVLLVNPAATYAVTHEPGVQGAGRTRITLALTEDVAANLFERIDVTADSGSGLPLETRATSVEEAAEWTLRYQFGNRLDTRAGPVPFLSVIEVSQKPSGESWVLRIERPFLIDRWKVPRVLR